MTDKQKRERLLTPVGEAKWCHLNKPKPPYKDAKTGKADPDRGAKYQLDVVFDPADPAWKVWATDIKARALKAGKNVPISQERDADNVPTGRFFATFKTGEQYPPQVFDPFGRPYAPVPLVGNGSKVQVNFTPAEYKGLGGGITLYLNAVQVRDLKVYESRTADTYGFEVSPPSEPTLPEGVDPEEWEAAPQDDLPF